MAVIIVAGIVVDGFPRVLGPTACPLMQDLVGQKLLEGI